MGTHRKNGGLTLRSQLNHGLKVKKGVGKKGVRAGGCVVFFKLFYLRDQEEFRRKKVEWLWRLQGGMMHYLSK